MSRNRFLFIMGTVIALILLTVVLGRNSDSPQIVAASMLATTLRFATPITLGALAGLFCERSGVVNIAIEGMMLAAAMAGTLLSPPTTVSTTHPSFGARLPSTKALVGRWGRASNARCIASIVACRIFN